MKIKADFHIDDLFEYDVRGAAERFGITDGLDVIVTLSYERYMQDGHFGLDTLGEYEQRPLWSGSISARSP